MKNIIDLTWKEIESLPKDNTFLLMTVAPIEEHGIHLPISVDIQLGEYWKQLSIEELETSHPDFHFLSLPYLPLAAGSMKTFPGCVYTKARKLRKIMIDFLRNIVNWGIENFVIIASHGDPFHNMAIEKACDWINKRYDTNYISPMGAFFSNEELNIDLKLGNDVYDMIKKHPNDFHAGWIETSMMMEISPKMILSNIKEIEDIVVTEKEMIHPNKYIKKTKGKGHLGYPQYSKLSLGRDLNFSTKNYIVSIVEKIINGDNIDNYKHHFLYKLPFLRVLV